MYTEHFGLNEKPFSISPDPRYLYLSQRHADALAHLLYGISESGGFIQLTGEVGTGKTTLIRSVLGQLPEKTEIALILNPKLSTKQFLEAICHELRVSSATRDTAKSLIDKLNERLLELHAEGRRVVLIVDEAQTMSPELLEQVRLLTNLETEKQKLLQIILIGQPELRDVLGRSDMRQVAQRITGRYHLEPLTARDSAVYVSHRMRVAGGRPEIFSKRAIRRLFSLSRGVPRLINIVADRALLAAFARDETRIDAGLVGRAADEVFGRVRTLRWWPWAAAVAGVALILWGVALLMWSDAFLEFDGRETLELAMTDADETAPDRSEPTSDRPTDPTGDSPGEPPRPTSLGLLLAAGGADADRLTEQLFTLWGASYSAQAGPACDQAEAQGLKCLRSSSGSFGELRAIDRPALLELATPKGAPHQVLLVGLDETEAMVSVGGALQRVPVAELTLFTTGDPLVLFRPAIAGEEGPLAEGARGPGVIWLRTSLASLGHVTPGSEEPDLFDTALASALGDYQRDREFVVDGVLGDRTLISLQTDIGLVGVSLKAGMR
ncbi:MAG TPA: AAA family ATPase [Gammaproteobacteria bacterium]|nr:AAA family ATPase [Gammaproteobacteria bacterium]